MSDPSETGFFELVTGVVRLHKLAEFKQLHRDRLLPLFRKYRIKPVLFLITETGTVGRFYDIYEYKNMGDYEHKIQAFLKDPGVGSYYEAVEPCLLGTIETILLRASEYSPKIRVTGKGEYDPGFSPGIGISKP